MLNKMNGSGVLLFFGFSIIAAVASNTQSIKDQIGTKGGERKLQDIKSGDYVQAEIQQDKDSFWSADNEDVIDLNITPNQPQRKKRSLFMWRRSRPRPSQRRRRRTTVATTETTPTTTPVSVTTEQEEPAVNNVPSGQLIRLRGGSSYLEGRVEVWRDGRWGVVCDDDWDLRDANVVCKQLGFRRGAETALTSTTFHSNFFTSEDIVMDEVHCSGAENQLQDCTYDRMHNCLTHELAGVRCHPNEGCEAGWLAGRGVCYKIMSEAANVDVATSRCQQMDSQLVSIYNQEENDFLSEYLLTEGTAHYWTVGRQFTEPTTGRGQWLWRDSQARIVFNKWFPGVPPNNAARRPSHHPDQDCIAMARTFYSDDMDVFPVDYFFWNDAACSVEMPFICKKVMDVHTEDCYEGTGADYRGTAHKTMKGTLCQRWTLSNRVHPDIFPRKGLGNHNYCRNPDHDRRPWCWVDARRGKYGYCAVRECGDEPHIPTTNATTSVPGIQSTTTTTPTTSTTTTTTTTASAASAIERTTTAVEPTTPEGNCRPDEIFCSEYDGCVPLSYKCDGYPDCQHGIDEIGCVEEIEEFERKKYHHLIPPSSNYTEVQYLHLTIKSCAEKCMNARQFVCRSFNFQRAASNAPSKCNLFDVNRNMGGTVEFHLQYYYFELISQADACSSEYFSCNNSKCIEHIKVCNGHDDCNDFSDEENCSEEPVNVSMRLVGGDTEHEGRIEVQYLGEWGTVCDDRWDLKDAHVVCRELGYSGGAVEATSMSRFGAGSGNFLLDEVHCEGDEDSLEDCPHDPWRQHDCRDYETAGVICMASKVCTSEQFQCHTGDCVPITAVCDQRNNCRDGTDEAQCDDLTVELVGGDRDQEGRLEIIRNGVRGTVCDDSFDDTAAGVICEMLGYRGAARLTSRFGSGHGVIWLDDVSCRSGEETIDDCRHSNWGSHDCQHSEDVGIVCGSFSRPARTTPLPASPVNGNVQCGKRPIQQIESRIVGGFDTRYGAFPWQAVIRKKNNFGREFSHLCGATVIHERWILSAAHCFTGAPKQHFRVRVGDQDNTVHDTYEREFEIEELYTHEKYAKVSHDNDIAVAKLKVDSRGPIIFSDHIQPACLPNRTTPYTPGQRCYISGWGTTGRNIYGTVYTDNLKAAVVPILDDDVCRRLYKYSTTKRMLCAGYLQGNIDSCQGDSGGPLVCLENGSHTVLGVVSYGIGCAEAMNPGVYTKVGQFDEWINQKMNSGA